MITKDQKKVILLGVHSFLDSHLKVGIQYIAEGLAKSGWQVDYISIFSSLFDFYGTQRRIRLRRVWLKHQDKHGIAIRPGLTEYAFRAPFPAHKHFLRYGWQVRLFDALAPSWLRKKKYDLCINDVTANIVYLKCVRADFSVLRLNDLPEGFRHSLSRHIINLISNYTCSNRYDEVWAAHAPLTRYAIKKNPANRVLTIRNGVDDNFLTEPPKIQRNVKTAVYIGSIEPWVDLELLEKTASLMPDWQFDIIGPLNREWSIKSANMRWLPPIARSEVKNVLACYQVGLIPFREISGRLAYVERPLKFFEYIGAGLGVVCTDIGSLKSGIGEWTSFGNSPEAFADAIRGEAIRASKRSKEKNLEIIEPHTWCNVMKKINSRLEGLVSVGTSV